MAELGRDITLPLSPAASTLKVSQLAANHIGARYQGEISITTGRREGHGKYSYPNPYFTYEGEWLDGKKHGQGRLSFSDGGYYDGEFREGEIVGEGTRKWADGSSYVGQFLDGLKYGNGVYDKFDGTHYEGCWEEGKYAGEGDLTLPNGDKYKGGFRAHRYHGHGALSQPKADREYVGAFEAGVFQGEGELRERGGAFTYRGGFRSGTMAGRGEGADTVVGIAYAGEWAENAPAPKAVAWDIGVPEGEDSYIPMAEWLKTEAATQLNSSADDKKKQDKAKKDPKKFGSGAQTEDPPPETPELRLFIGEPMPEVALRLVGSDGQRLKAETGRRFRVTMYKERKMVSKDDPNEVEVLRRPVRFNDRRETFVDPLDEVQAPSGKASPAPPKPAEDEAAEEVQIGEEAREGAIGESGELRIGGNEEWFLPVHLQQAIYWLRVEDATELPPGSCWERLAALEVPFRVTPPEGK